MLQNDEQEEDEDESSDISRLLEEANSQTAAAQSELQRKAEELARVQEELKQSQQREDALSAELSQSNDDVTSLQNSLLVKNAIIDQLKAEAHVAAHREQHLRMQNEQVRRNLSDAHTQLAQMRGKDFSGEFFRSRRALNLSVAAIKGPAGLSSLHNQLLNALSAVSAEQQRRASKEMKDADRLRKAAEAAASCVCPICYDKSATVACVSVALPAMRDYPLCSRRMVPCGHAICSSCQPRIDHRTGCPLCRRHIAQFLKLFMDTKAYMRAPAQVEAAADSSASMSVAS